jgi:hypothetical protein
MSNLATKFDEAVAGWDNKIPCVWETDSGRSCRRAAHWDLNIHGCMRGTLCGHHFRTWQRDNDGCTLCPHCGVDFPSFADIYTARKL